MINNNNVILNLTFGLCPGTLTDLSCYRCTTKGPKYNRTHHHHHNQPLKGYFFIKTKR